MPKIFENLHPIIFVIIATTLEVTGDAVIRMCLHNHTGVARIGLAFLGALLLFGYGVFLNLAPVSFAEVVGIYIATLFVVWQIVNFIAFKTVPSVPIIIGGIFIIAGGIIITFWKT